MAHDMSKLLDGTNWRILEELQDNARISFAELGRRVGLSVPGVTERVHKLEDAGVLTGYHAAVDLKRLGLATRAVVSVRVGGAFDAQVVVLAREIPEVVRCYRVTGSDCYFLELAVATMERLEQVLDRFHRCGQTTTSIVVSASMDRRSITRAALPGDDVA